jgi:spore coat polysaccharide biosynthesis predicted glycosyltransferase SpsG
MSDRSIAIVCEWGQSYGNGHIQRMSALLWYLNKFTGFKAILLNKKTPDFFDKDMRAFISPYFNKKAALVIRDMRDSTADEINQLKKKAPVLAIDDLGDGRSSSDFVLDLLPNPNLTDRNDDFVKNLFIYGYNFIQGILNLHNQSFKKSIDFALYPGANSPVEYINFLISLLPEKSSIAVLAGKNSYIKKGRDKEKLNPDNYAQTLLASKILISHFGILLYEASLAGCKIITINPGAYHSMLSDIAPGYLEISNLGVYSEMDKDSAIRGVQEIISNIASDVICAEKVFDAIKENLEKFCDFLKSILS